MFSYEILTPAALNFFVSYAEGAVESLWSIDQYFQFVLVLMLSTGLSFQVRAVRSLREARRARRAPRCGQRAWLDGCAVFAASLAHGCIQDPPRPPPALHATTTPRQVPVIQVMLGQLGIVSSTQMFSLWRYVVVGSTVVAAVLTPSTDPFTQALLAIPLVGLYMGGAGAVRLIEQSKGGAAGAGV